MLDSNLRQLILGGTKQEADRIVQEWNKHVKNMYNPDYILRVAKKDGKYFVCTQDYNINRINLFIQDDLIIEAYLG